MSRFSNWSSTALPAAEASGLPPYVLAWSPGLKTSALDLHSIAPIGTPPPSALAVVKTAQRRRGDATAVAREWAVAKGGREAGWGGEGSREGPCSA